MSIPNYGIDRELAKKTAEKYDPNREADARKWIEEVVGESFPSESFQQSLKDGVLLVKLANKTVPGHNVQPQVSSMPFKQMENINTFLRALDTLGIPKHNQFMTIDLYEAKNLGNVVDAIYALSRHATKAGFNGPQLESKPTEKKASVID